MHELAIEDNSGHGKMTVVDAEPPIEGDKLNIKELIDAKIREQKLFYSIEVSPVVSPQELDYKSFSVKPLFTSITWLGDGNLRPNNVANSYAFALANIVKNSTAVLQHISCYNLTNLKLEEILKQNVKNIFALKGDEYNEHQPMKHAVDLVRAIKHIRSECCVGVAGFPEGHSDAKNLLDDLHHLKEKVDAGADFIITQICFEIEKLEKFIKSCRALEIRAPIIPGIFIPTSYNSLVRMCEICKVTCPPSLLEEYKSRKDDEHKFNEFAISQAVKFLDAILKNGCPEKLYGVHFFTLNKYQNVHEILKRYNFNN